MQDMNGKKDLLISPDMCQIIIGVHNTPFAQKKLCK